MSDFIQFDTAETVIGGINIAEAVQIDQRLVFNESYTLAGKRLSAPLVHASYDLTVIGDVDVEELTVMGNLYVIGSIRAKKLSCHKVVICSGDINAETVTAGEIVANDISCYNISCSGNIVARTTIDIGETLKAEKSVLTGEGILGSGLFSAKNAVAAEYFDFDGEVLGNVLELETDASFGKAPDLSSGGSLEAFSEKIKGLISEELKKAGEVDEERLVKVVHQLSEFDDFMISDWGKLTEHLIELSYAEKITNLLDYLMVIMEKRLLPKEIIGYETIEHVFGTLLTEAEKEVASLPFHAKDAEDLAYALKIVTLCEKELGMEKEEVLDRIFQSIGIKYKTVKSFLSNIAEEVR